MRALTVMTAFALALSGCSPSVAEQISAAGKSAPDEAAHIQMIAGKKKRHFACAVAQPPKGPLRRRHPPRRSQQQPSVGVET
jgi:uncharacterized protein YceK